MDRTGKSKSIIPPDTADRVNYGQSPLYGLARKIILSHFKRLKRGRLNIIEGNRRHVFGEYSDRFPIEATVTVHHPRTYLKLMLGGTVGAGESYMENLWSADDLTKVVRIVVLNQDLFEVLRDRHTLLTLPISLTIRFINRNTRFGSRKNIRAHYDLGNDFYSLFLDETMTYSCGIFDRDDSTLKDASLAKYDRICRKLRLGPDDHVLEIGTGWGGFAVYAASNYGCRITTTTISKAQYETTEQRIERAGLKDRVELLLEDYRDIEGTYDKLVSIEMIEAVGHQYMDTFFECCGRLLKDDGMMLLQAITIADHAFDRHKHSIDFIKRFIFPGSCIPSVTSMCGSISRKTNLRLVHLEDITPHYAKTLRTWRERFFDNIDRVRAMGFSDTFIRMWEFYLSYCEAGFEERYLSDVQMLFTKPLCRQQPILPAIEF